MLFFEMVFLCDLCASAYSALREVFFMAVDAVLHARDCFGDLACDENHRLNSR